MRSIFVVIVLAAARFDFLPFIFNCWFAPALMVGVTLYIIVYVGVVTSSTPPTTVIP